MRHFTIGDLVTTPDQEAPMRVTGLTVWPGTTQRGLWVQTAQHQHAGPYPVEQCVLVMPCVPLPRSHWGDVAEHLAGLQAKAARERQRDLVAGWIVEGTDQER